MKTKFFKIIPFVLLTIFAVFPFLGNLHDTFLSDDWDFLRIVSSQEFPLSHYFTSNYTGSHEGGSYRPMINVFWSGLFALFGFNPLPYHSVMIGLHVLVTLLLFLFLRELFSEKPRGRLSALVGALLFTLLPSHSEPVIWIAAAGDLLGTTFSLTSILLFTKAVKNPLLQKRITFFVFSFGAFALALLSKESSITLPLIHVGIVWFINKEQNTRQWKNFLWAIVPFLIVGVFFLLRSQAIHLVTTYYGGALSFTPKQVITSFIHLLLSNFLPTSNRVLVGDFLLSHFFGLIVGIALLFISLIFFIFKKNAASLLLFGALIASALPVSSFVIENSTVYLSSEGERWTYFPSVFLSGLLGLWISHTVHFFSHKKAILGLLVAMGALTGGGLLSQLIQKNMYWHQGAVLAHHTLEELAHAQKKYDFDGAVLIGVPDSMHGVPLFRNMFSTAFAHSTGVELDMIVTPSKTLFDQAAQFEKKRISKNEFLYTEKNLQQRITGQINFSCPDYTSSLQNTSVKNILSTGGKIGSSYTIQFSEDFMKHNEQKKIGILFFDQGNWIVEIL